jgi:sugar O-acyltransferase (sialic acid O-acetyltransferase NeuD family)
MQEIVIYGIGSALTADYEEILRRSGVPIAYGVRNRPVPDHLDASQRIVNQEDLSKERSRPPFLVPMFTPGNRQEAVEEAITMGFREPFCLIDPFVVIPAMTTFGDGFFVNTGSILGARSAFGRFVSLNRGASVGHHAVVEDFVSVGPGAVICGQVSIGKGSYVGAGSVVLPEVKIGANAVIGAGAVVTGDVEDRAVMIGNPAKAIPHRLGGFGGKLVT